MAYRQSNASSNEHQKLTAMPPDGDPGAQLEPTALTKATMTALGVAVLLPFNCVLSTVPFFMNAFPGYGFESLGFRAYSTFLFLSLLLMTLGGEAVSCWKRNVVGFSVTAGCLVLLVISATLVPGATGFYLAVFAFGSIGLFGAIAQSTTLEIASQSQSSDLIINFFFGQGIAGILAFGAVVLTMLLAGGAKQAEGGGGDQPMTNEVVLTFYVTTAVFLFVCSFSHLWLKRDPVIRAAVGASAAAAAELDTPGGSRGAAGGGWSRSTGRKMKKTLKAVISATRDVALLSFDLAMVFIVTFIVFPAASSKWTSAMEGLNTQWLQTALVGTFQIGDVVGKYLPKFKWAGIPARLLIVPVVLRGTLIPLFCERAVGNGGLLAGILLVMFVLSVTNGWFATAACVHIGQQAKEEDKGIAGRLMGVYVCLGIMVGSWLAGTCHAIFC